MRTKLTCVSFFSYYCIYALGFHPMKEPISAKAKVAHNQRQEKKNRGVFLHSQRKICRRRKVAWVLERPQFWFEHMLLNQYAGSLTGLEGSFERKIIHLRRKKLRRGHRSLGRRIKIELACYISNFKCDMTALSDELTTSCFSLEEIDC